MPRPAILCHGGVGADPVSDYQPGVEAACEQGWQVLQETDSALEAAIAATVALEDDIPYNAGTGSYMKLDGTIAMDAAVALYDPKLPGEFTYPTDSGATRYGAVAGIMNVANPVKVARAVMDTPAVLLTGQGAIRFARSQGFEPFDPATEKAYKKKAEMNRKVKEGTAPAWAMKWEPWLDPDLNGAQPTEIPAGAEMPAAPVAPAAVAKAAVAPFPLGIPVGLLIVDGQGCLGWADNDEGRLPVAVKGGL